MNSGGINTKRTVTPFKKRRSTVSAVASKTALRLLVVLDSTTASGRVLDYLCTFFARQRNVCFCLACLLPRVPAGLMESGGADAPLDEERVEAALRVEQDLWMASLDKTSGKVLGRSATRLHRAGIRSSAIDTCYTSPLDNRTTADEVLLIAEIHHCRTIVVGHGAHSWFRGLGGDHLAEQLVRQAKGFAVWVID